MLKIWFQIEGDVGEPCSFEQEFETVGEAEEAMDNLVSLGSDTFRERLIALAGLSFEEFSLIVYDKPCVELAHVREYMLVKYAKFREDPLGLILTLDSRNFQRVYGYLIVNGGK